MLCSPLHRSAFFAVSILQFARGRRPYARRLRRRATPMPTNDSPAKSRPPEPVLFEIGLAEHFVEVVLVVVSPFCVVVVVVLPTRLAVTIAEKLAATEPVKVESM